MDEGTIRRFRVGALVRVRETLLQAFRFEFAFYGHRLRCVYTDELGWEAGIRARDSERSARRRVPESAVPDGIRNWMVTAA